MLVREESYERAEDERGMKEPRVEGERALKEQKAGG